MSKIWEKIRTRTYCKFLLLPFKCDSQSGPENQVIREMSSHCDKNSAHNVGGKSRWIPLMSPSMPMRWSNLVGSLFYFLQIFRHLVKILLSRWWRSINFQGTQVIIGAPLASIFHSLVPPFPKLIDKPLTSLKNQEFFIIKAGCPSS